MPTLFPRPKDEFLHVSREAIDTECPKCQSLNVKRYPVLKPRGWAVTTKCQDCFFELLIQYPNPGGPFEPVTKDLDFSPIG